MMYDVHALQISAAHEHSLWCAAEEEGAAGGIAECGGATEGSPQPQACHHPVRHGLATCQVLPLGTVSHWVFSVNSSMHTYWRLANSLAWVNIISACCLEAAGFLAHLVNAGGHMAVHDAMLR